MTVEDTLQDADQRMRSAVSWRATSWRHPTGRANAKLLDRISVDYYGTKTPLNQLASFSVPEPRLLVIQPFDKSAMGAMEKAIMQSDLGLTPSNDGNVIRLAFPALTEERRKELIRIAHERPRRLGSPFETSGGTPRTRSSGLSMTTRFQKMT